LDLHSFVIVDAVVVVDAVVIVDAVVVVDDSVVIVVGFKMTFEEKFLCNIF